MPLLDRSQLAAQELQKLIQQDWFHPQTLHQYLEALKIWQPNQVAVTIDGQAVYLNRILYDLKQFLQGLPLSTQQSLAKYGLTASSFEKFPLPSEILTVLDQTLIEIAGLTPQAPESNIPQNLKELVAEAEQKEQALAAAQDSASQYTTAANLSVKEAIARAREAHQKLLRASQEINQQNHQIAQNTAAAVLPQIIQTKHIQNLKTIARAKSPAAEPNIDKIIARNLHNLNIAVIEGVQQTLINASDLYSPQKIERLVTAKFKIHLGRDITLNAAFSDLPKKARQEIISHIVRQIFSAVIAQQPQLQEISQSQKETHLPPKQLKQQIASQLEEAVSQHPAVPPFAKLKGFGNRLVTALDHVPGFIKNDVFKILENFGLPPELSQTIGNLTTQLPAPKPRLIWLSKLSRRPAAALKAWAVRSPFISTIGKIPTAINRSFSFVTTKITSPFRAVGNWAGKTFFAPVKTWVQTAAAKTGTKIAAWGAQKIIETGGKGLVGLLGKVAVGLGIRLGGEATAAAIAQAVPVVGQIIGIVMAAGMALDIAKTLWQNRGQIGQFFKKNILPALGAIAIYPIVILGNIIHALGAASFAAIGGVAGSIIGWAVGGNLGSALIGGGVGALGGTFIQAGGLSGLASGIGTSISGALGSASGLITAFGAPGAFSGATAAIASTAVIGGLGAVVGVAIIQNIYINTALMAPAEGDVQINCENAPQEKPEVAPGDILFSSDQRYAFPVAPFSKIYYGCIHHDYPATDIGIYGDAAHDPPLGAHLPVIAFTSGTISWISESDTLGGKSFIIQADPDSSGKVYYYYYAHNCTQYISQGQHVNVGDVIATTNNTGNAAHTIEHLHFQVCTLEDCVTIPDNYSFFLCPGLVFKERLGINNCTPDELLNCVPS